MGINECLVPSVGRLVLDLDDMGECNGAVALHQILEGGVLAVIRGLHGVLDLRQHGSPRNSRFRRGDVGCQ